MATTNDLKNGTVLNLDGQLWSVIWFQHHKPGKGGAVVRSKLKNVMSGKVVDKTFNADMKIETANADKRSMSYLYHDGDAYIFMDTETYEQTAVPGETVADAANFMLENQVATVAVHEGLPLYIELPASVELLIDWTEPGLEGDRWTGGERTGARPAPCARPGRCPPSCRRPSSCSSTGRSRVCKATGRPGERNPPDSR